MLRIQIPSVESFDEGTGEFLATKDTTLDLEHSLHSLSKWESKWHKPYLVKTEKTQEEALDYIRCMTVTKNVDPDVYYALTRDNLEAIHSYLEDTMTATTFHGEGVGKQSREVMTSELIYHGMIAYNIPFECEKWHLNRLLALIKVCGIKNEDPKKMSRKDVMGRNRSLNSARRQRMNSPG